MARKRGLYSSYKSPVTNYDTNTGNSLLGNLQNPAPQVGSPVELYNQDLSSMLSTYSPNKYMPQSKQGLYGVDVNQVSNMPTYPSSGNSTMPGMDSTGLFGSLWQGAKDFGSSMVKPLTGTEMNPGKSMLDYGLSGLSGLSSIYGAYKQGEYSDKMAKLADRQQGLYESQIADQNRRRDLAQANYNNSFK